jgi:hypothetical protein
MLSAWPSSESGAVQLPPVMRLISREAGYVLSSKRKRLRPCNCVISLRFSFPILIRIGSDCDSHALAN